MDSMDTIISGLDADQRRAVLHDAGPLLLVAGAGAGKTRTIVARIVRLVRDGVAPRQIVGITFTNRAAEEMRERVARELGSSPGAGPAEPDLPWLGTFHAFGSILLRRFGSRIGLPAGFVIYDARDQLDLVREAVRENNLDDRKFPPGLFLDVIERAKRDGVPFGEAAAYAGPFVRDKAGAVGKAYEEALRSAGAVDFADLIRYPLKIFREAPEVLAAVHGEIRHLLVDEFQDVDRAQAGFARAIALGAESFCAVGDEDQSIYGWRGGSAGPMLSFERDYPGAAVLTLGTNYRTKSSILAAAGELIAANRARREKRVRAAREGGDPPAVSVHADADVEAAAVARAVAGEIRRGTKPEEIAVFYRVNAQSRPLEDALREAAVPYVLRGALSFYDRAVVRDALAYLKWFVNPGDAVSLKRLLKAPRRGVGEAALARAREEAKRSGTGYPEALARIPALSPLFALAARWTAALPGRGPGEAFRALLDESGYLAWVAERSRGEEAQAAPRREEDAENVRELLRLASACPGTGPEAIREFLERVSLSPREAAGDETAAIRLMTLHTAKGLEFDTVFLVGLEEGLLPHSRSAGSAAEIEEERRLFYVGLTRARERAALSFARRRFLFGSFRDSVPSRFLAEIPPALLRWAGVPSGVPARAGAPGAGLTVSFDRGPRGGTGRIAFQRQSAAPPAAVAPRSTIARPKGVRHPVFGEGRVESLEGEGADRKVVARFPGYGVRKILVRAVAMEFLD